MAGLMLSFNLDVLAERKIVVKLYKLELYW